MSLEMDIRRMHLREKGHDDVASAKNQVKVAMSALEKMQGELDKLSDEESLPTWWTNKVAIAVDKIDGMADYLDTQVEETLHEENYYKVDIEGLPTMYVTGTGPGGVKAGLRKIVRKPEMITGIERVTKTDVRKAFRMKMMDKEEQE